MCPGIHLHLHLPTTYAYTNADCDSHSFKQSDTDTQTNAHSEIAYDPEAAPDSAAKAVGRPNNWERMRRATVCAAVNH